MKKMLSILLFFSCILHIGCNKDNTTEVDIDFTEPYLIFNKNEAHDVVQQKIKEYETREEITGENETLHLIYKGENTLIDKIVYEILDNGGQNDFWDVIVYFNCNTVNHENLLIYMNSKEYEEVTSVNMITRYKDSKRNLYIDLYTQDPDSDKCDLKISYFPIR